MDKGEFTSEGSKFCPHGVLKTDYCLDCIARPTPANGSDLLKSSPILAEPEPVSVRTPDQCPTCGLVPCKTHGPRQRRPIDRIRTLMAAYDKLENAFIGEASVQGMPNQDALRIIGNAADDVMLAVQSILFHNRPDMKARSK